MKLELITQNKKLKDKWNDEILNQIAEKRFRSRLAARISVPTFEELCEKQPSKLEVASESPALPGVVISPSEGRDRHDS